MIFKRYAADAEVTRFVGWPRHTSIGDTISFLEFSSSEWSRWPAGPLLIRLWPSHSASIRVLERGGFSRESVATKHLVFPNLGDDSPQDAACYTYANLEAA